MWKRIALVFAAICMLVSMVAAHGRLSVPTPRTADNLVVKTSNCGGGDNETPKGIVATATAGQPFRVQWTITADHRGDFDINLSRDGGATFNPVVQNIDKDLRSADVIFDAACDSCVLQWVWKPAEGNYYGCADIKILAAEGDNVVDDDPNQPVPCASTGKLPVPADSKEPEDVMIGCAWYSDSTCCPEQEKNYLYKDQENMLDAWYGGANKCSQMFKYLTCITCSPSSGRYYNQTGTAYRVCKSFVEDHYAACSKLKGLIVRDQSNNEVNFLPGQGDDAFTDYSKFSTLESWIQEAYKTYQIVDDEEGKCFSGASSVVASVLLPLVTLIALLFALMA